MQRECFRVRYRKLFVITSLLLVVLLCPVLMFAQGKSSFGSWKMLERIPDDVGFAGSFAGVSNGALLVAGGANFAGGGAPWLGSKKVWYDGIFVLTSPKGKWENAGKLPKPLGYGVSVSTKDGVIVIGGSNEFGHYSDVYCLRFNQGKVEVTTLPSLPVTLANSSGALAGDKIYVLGGTINPDEKETKNIFLRLDLKDLQKGWIELPQLPGPSRMLAVAATVNQTFYVFSGAELHNGERTYLKDCYSYSEKNGWCRIADIPDACVAAPSPTYGKDDAIYIFGGDNGNFVKSDLRENHPGFSTSIFKYRLKSGKWSKAGEIEVIIKADAKANPNGSIWAPVTTTLVVWNDMVVFPGGEVRPATRTTNVLAVELKRTR